MSEFDNNGYQTDETVETVENVETIDNSQATDNYNTGSTYTDPGYQQAPNYDQTTYYGAAEPEENGSKPFAIASLVCGIVSLLCSCCGWLGIIISVAAVVLGIISINKKNGYCRYRMRRCRPSDRHHCSYHGCCGFFHGSRCDYRLCGES